MVKELAQTEYQPPLIDLDEVAPILNPEQYHSKQRIISLLDSIREFDPEYSSADSRLLRVGDGHETWSSLIYYIDVLEEDGTGEESLWVWSALEGNLSSSMIYVETKYDPVTEDEEKIKRVRLTGYLLEAPKRFTFPDEDDSFRSLDIPWAHGGDLVDLSDLIEGMPMPEDTRSLWLSPFLTDKLIGNVDFSKAKEI